MSTSSEKWARWCAGYHTVLSSINVTSFFSMTFMPSKKKTLFDTYNGSHIWKVGQRTKSSNQPTWCTKYTRPQNFLMGRRKWGSATDRSISYLNRLRWSWYQPCIKQAKQPRSYLVEFMLMRMLTRNLLWWDLWCCTPPRWMWLETLLPPHASW